MIDKLPLVSVITVVFNGEKFIEKTILSVINQSYSNFEYIIIDGKSCDGTMKVLEKYKKNITKIVSEKDKGVFDAMNKSIRLATGEWIIFMNAGDTFYSLDTLSSINWKENEGYCLVYGKTFSDNAIRRPFPQKSLYYGLIYACHQSTFYNRNLLGSELYYNEKYNVYSDYDLAARIYNKKYPTKYFDITVSDYLGGGISSKISTEARKAKYYFVFRNFGIKGVIVSILSRIRIINFPERID